jgi:hypothetical protein
MAIYIPIVSEFKSSGIDRAKKEFRSLSGAGAKTGFLLKKAFVPATAALGAFSGFMVKAAEGAEDARKANRALGNVLKSMGVGQATDRLTKFADELEKVVGVEAEVIKATQTKLATFAGLAKSVDNAGGAFDRATKAALDLAAAGFGTAESNATQLGKALENPIKGLAALAKSGVTFTDQEKEKIKTLVESGKLLEAQDIILQAIEKQVGGTAEATASSFEKMKNAIGGVSDVFGDLLLPVIDELAPRLQNIQTWAEENPDKLKQVSIAIAGITASIIAMNLAWKATVFYKTAGALGPLGTLVAGFATAYLAIESFRLKVNAQYNKWVGYIEGTINTLVRAFNPLIAIVNKLLPGDPLAELGLVNIPRLSTTPASLSGEGFAGLNIPAMANGGIVSSATIALIGESGPEAVIPLDRMGNMGGGINVTVNAGLLSSPDQVGQQIIEAIQKAQRRSGPVFAPA